MAFLENLATFQLLYYEILRETGIRDHFLNLKDSLVHFLKIWKVISPFLNFDSSTGDFLKNAKISLVLLIGPFLIRTDCV